MYFLVDICCETTYKPIWMIVGTIVKILWIGIPILLIILGIVDLGKAVIASKEDEVKKATKSFGKRFLYAIGAFLVVWLVGIALSTVLDMFDSKDVTYDKDEPTWRACWSAIIRDGVAEDKYCPNGHGSQS